MKLLKKCITVLLFILYCTAAFAEMMEVILKNSSEIPDNVIIENVRKISFPADTVSVDINIFRYDSGSEIYSMEEDGSISVTSGMLKISCSVTLTRKKKGKKIFTLEIESENIDSLVLKLCEKISEKI